MIIDETALRTSIRTRLLTVTNENMPGESDIAWENREYSPKIGVPWIRETMLPGTERQSASDTIESVGIMQYDFFWPANRGTTEIENLVVDIKTAFKPLTVLDSHSSIYRTERLPAIVDENWYQIPVRLTWRAHAIG
jgi:hypothetical protein